MKSHHALVSILSATAFMPMALSSQVCVALDPIKMEGDVTFLGSNFGDPNIGAQSIGTYSGVNRENSYPNQSRINGIDISYKSVCIVTEPGVKNNVPTCNFNFQMRFCSALSGKCVNGSFSAYGNALSKIMITGGSDGLFAATGQIDTSAFKLGEEDPVTGKLIGNSIDMEFKLCYDVFKLYLTDFGGSPSIPLGLCEGDCDDDNDCRGDLVCYFRDGFLPVPGCIGDGKNDYDYCIEKPFISLEL